MHNGGFEPQRVTQVGKNWVFGCHAHWGLDTPTKSSLSSGDGPKDSKNVHHVGLEGQGETPIASNRHTDFVFYVHILQNIINSKSVLVG